MKIFGICVAKNELDILPHTLDSARRWCDKIFLLDNGSSDGTWEYMQHRAKWDNALIAWKQDFRPFNNAIRADIFNQFRALAKNDDWWCRLDADEIYVDSPREFLSKINNSEVVWGLHLQYYFTERDLELYTRRPELYRGGTPPEKLYRYYKANASEPRFFKYRERLKWESGAWPRHLGRVFERRLLIRHYQWRSPSQMQSRLNDRIAAMKLAGEGFDYLKHDNWSSYVRASSDLSYDCGNNSFEINISDIPSHNESILRVVAKTVLQKLRVLP
jgi:hypothetical protein